MILLGFTVIVTWGRPARHEGVAGTSQWSRGTVVEPVGTPKRVHAKLSVETLLGGPRSVAGWSYLEAFMAAAIAAVLVIRTFLELSGFPKLGGNGLHIAHLLWGGL